MKDKKKLSRQRRWQLKQTAAGRCTICGKPLADNSKSFCPEHRERNRRRNFIDSRKRAGIPLNVPKHTKYNKKP